MKKNLPSLLEKPSKNDIANSITTELKKYDIIDFLNKISALYLFPNNQNKALVFDTLIASILEKPKSYFSGTAKISNNKFQNIVNYSMSFPIAKNIDPPEMPFIHRILFYGNHWIFSGINKDIGYRLQGLLDILFKNGNGFNQDFINDSSLITHTILTISTKICADLHYDRQILGHYEKTDIDYPNTQNIKKAQQALSVDIDFLKRFIQSEELEKLISEFGENQFNHTNNPENFRFYYKPFLRISESTLFVLNPSELGSFLINYILKKAAEYGCFDDVIKAYNEYIFQQCLESFKKLDHKKIVVEPLEIDLISTDSYKEVLLNVVNNGLLFVQFFCDSGNKYNFENMHELIKINNFQIGKRWAYIQEKLKGYPQDRIYQICISCSFSRVTQYKTIIKQSFRQLLLSPFDLYCIAVNEHSHRNFIPRYMDCKYNMLEPFTLYGDIYNISVYCDRYSFYLDDNFDYRKDIFYLGFDNAIDYFNKAIISENKFLADCPNAPYLLEMIRLDSARNIYMSHNKETIYILNKFSNIDIWQLIDSTSTTIASDIYHTVTDMCSYWIAECKNIITGNSFHNNSIVIEHKLTGNLTQYFSSESYSESALEDLLKIQILDNIITFIWTPEAYFKFSNENNSQEKAITTLLLESISCFSTKALSMHKVDKLFENPLKKKAFFLNAQEYPYLKPIDLDFRKVSIEYEQLLSDEIGYFLIKEKGVPFGEIKKNEKYSICSTIVDYLYKKLKTLVASLNPQNLIEQIYLDLEKVMYSMMLTQRRHAFNIACYPEKTDKLNSTYNQLNKSSIALKFFMEYVSAQPPKGNVLLGELEYENILTICSAIIHWAQIGDLFNYNIIDSEMNILKSGRVGINNTQPIELTESTYSAAIKRLTQYSNPHISKYHFGNDNIDFDDLNSAFIAEYGYSYGDFSKVVTSLLVIGEDIKSEICRINITKLLETIFEKTGIERSKISKIINDLSLKERPEYLPAPKGYKNTDIWPWRFNRRLSFTRRPLIMVDEDIVWGNRQLFHCLMFTYDLIKDGKLKAESAALKQVISKLSNSRGNLFNSAVAEKLNTIKGLIVTEKVKKINGKMIADANRNTLGDIDVLIIDTRRRKIIVGEVKDFSFSKSPYEMHQQYLNVFCDNGNKLCYISKHKRRVDWIKSHLNDVIEHYKLSKKNWKVDDILILSEPVISNEYYHKNQKTILFSDISEKSIYNL
ncbi:MAG: hypothetical protein IKY90_08380 [Oscillospiraceae bacterium]|nr:hypothetical protein [Oscillospiraceae bacterium]